MRNNPARWQNQPLRNADGQRVLWDLDPHVLQRHPPPHFHARSSEFEATVDIGTLEVIEG